MSRRRDRDATGHGIRSLALVAVVLALIAGSWFVWQRMQHPFPAAAPMRPVPDSAPAVQRQEETLAGAFYLPADGLLTAHASVVRKQPEPQLQARDVVAMVFTARQAEAVPVLRDVRLRSLFLDEGGTAYVDLVRAQTDRKEVHASAWDELLAVYALVNTVMKNVPEVRQVRLLVDGREGQTLAGHLDLTRAFVARTDLVRPQ